MKSLVYFIDKDYKLKQHPSIKRQLFLRVPEDQKNAYSIQTPGWHCNILEGYICKIVRGVKRLTRLRLFKRFLFGRPSKA